MPELKHSFTLGRMNKDLDERLVPQGEYRDALNVEVSTSEESNVGTIQTSMGNTKLSSIYSEDEEKGTCIGSIADDKNDSTYWLIAGEGKDIIAEFKNGKVNPVVVDVYKVITEVVSSGSTAITPVNKEGITKGMSVQVKDPSGVVVIGWSDGIIVDKVLGLNVWVTKPFTTRPSSGHTVTFRHPRTLSFDSNFPITGINIVDDLLFWTDNNSEPKKINIPKSKFGSPDFKTHTNYIVSDYYNPDPAALLNMGPVKEEHITVIKESPVTPPVLEMNFTDVRDVVDVTGTITPDDWGDPTARPDADLNARFTDEEGKRLKQDDKKTVLIRGGSGGNISPDYENGDILVIRTNTLEGGEEKTVRVRIDYIHQSPKDYLFDLIILSVGINVTSSDLNWVTTLEDKNPLFEFKFPRFACRYKYDDGEYSAFSPFTEVAFLPGRPGGNDFEYLPKKGFNLGMTNNLRNLALKDFVPEEEVLPDGVVAIDILYKESNSPNVYTVETITPDDAEWVALSYNKPTSTSQPYNTHLKGRLEVKSEMIHAILPSNQLLRPWDNVPRKALAQEITGNRLVYANYLQNYSVGDQQIDFNFAIKSQNGELDPAEILSSHAYEYFPAKSIKSLRTYQIGIVYRDKYGRETPVLSENKATGVLPSLYMEKSNADKGVKLTAKLNSTPPMFAESFKYYIKETSNEYYNLAMDRWYDAQDDNIWLSFPSSERNKVDIDTFLILKKERDTDVFVSAPARYKILAIENEAPDYVKGKDIILAHISNSDGVGVSGSFSSGADSFGSSAGIGFPVKDGAYIYVARTVWKDTHGLDEALDGKTNLFVRMKDDSNISEWYYIQSHALNATGSTDFYIIRVEGIFGDDMSFTSTAGTFATRVDNLILEVKERVLEDRPEFDGRFFVKVHKDAILETRVVKRDPSDQRYRVRLQDAFVYINDPERPEWETYSSGWNNDDHWHGFNVPKGEVSIQHNENVHNTNSGWRYWASVGLSSGIAGSAVSSESIAVQIDKSTSWVKYASDVTIETGEHYLGGGGTWIIDAAKGYWTGQWGTESYGGSPNGVNDANCECCSRGDSSKNWLRYYHWHRSGMAGKVTQWWEYHPVARTFKDDFKWGGWDHTWAGGTKGTDNAPKGIDFNDPNNPTGVLELSILQPGNNAGWKDRGSEHYSNLHVAGPTSGAGPRQPMELRDGIAGRLPGTDLHNKKMDFINSLLRPGTIWRWSDDPDLTLYETIGPVEYWAPNYGVGWGGETSNEVIFNFKNYFQPKESDEEGGQPDWACMGKSHKGDVIWAPWTSVSRRQKWKFAAKVAGTDGTLPEHYLGGGGPAQYLPTNDPRFVYVDGIGYHHLKWDGMGVPGNFKDAGGNSTTNPDLAVNGDNVDYQRDFNIDGKAPGIRADGMRNGLVDPAFGVTQIGSVGAWKGSVLLQIMEPIMESDLQLASHNPAVFETEPKEDVGLNIYYEVGQVYPVKLNSKTNELYIPVGSTVSCFRPSIGNMVVIKEKAPSTCNTCTAKVINCSDNTVTISFVPENDDQGSYTEVGQLPNGQQNLTDPIVIDDILTFTRIDGSATEAVVTGINGNVYELDPDIWKRKMTLPWFNCYSFGNGVESDRIRDDFNQVTIDNGPKASTTLEEPYQEERRGSGLIYSGVYNSTSGINNLNQFIQAEKITKDVNPIYGSIQKIHSRNTDLITLCEDKVLKILANKDAMFNADGDVNVTSNFNVLGQAVPFGGEYGISKNPESFVSESFRAYFSDSSRGAILRLSQDGLVPISEAGMKDYFSDNLRNYSKIIGSYDDKKSSYNVTLFNEDFKDTVIMTGYDPNNGNGRWISISSDYWSGSMSLGVKIGMNVIIKNEAGQVVLNTSISDVSRSRWQIELSGNGYLNLPTTISLLSDFTIELSESQAQSKTISWSEKSRGWTSFKSFIQENGLSLNNNYYTIKHGELYKHHDNPTRNYFYKDQYNSSVTVLFNEAPGSVKSFNTLNYEGSQAKITRDISDPEYYNNVEKFGWYVELMKTNLQTGDTLEFKPKEDKWFSYVKGESTYWDDSGSAGNVDTKEFSVQGIGYANIVDHNIEVIPGCMDPKSSNYNPAATFDDNSCIYPVGATWNCECDDTWLESTAEEIPSPPTYQWKCVDPGDGSGSFMDILSCRYSCGGGYCGPSTWDCVNGVCVDPNDGNGEYSTIEACETACTVHGCTDSTATNYNPSATIDDGSCVYPIYGCTDPLATNYYPGASVDDGSCLYPPTASWDCVDGFCVDPLTGNGEYSDLVACQSACIPPPSWNCIKGACVDSGDGFGTYSSLAACENACNIPSWDCVEGECVDPGTGNGQYSSLEACNSFCETQDTWNCVNGVCVNAGSSGGQYSTLTACQAGCSSSTTTTYTGSYI